MWSKHQSQPGMARLECGMTPCDPSVRCALRLPSWLFTVALALYGATNLLVFGLAGLALAWYVESRGPVVDSIDPDGPGYRVQAVTPEYVQVQWIELALVVDCPGRTEVAILGHRFATAIESYPFLIDRKRRTFSRRYRLPADLPPGSYEIRIIDIARCNPLFFNWQTLRVPFEIESPP